MFCETCKRGGEQRESPEVDPKVFYEGLRLGMHAMAQPMTLLLSHFYLARVTRSSATAQPLFSDAAAAIEELSTTFRMMQELLYVTSVAALVGETPLSCVLESLAEDAEAVFAGTGLRFDLRLDPLPGLVCGAEAQRQPGEPTETASAVVKVDMQRMRHATAGVLHVARVSAEPGSTVICSLAATNDGLLDIEFKLSQPRHAARDSFSGITLLKMDLAEASMVSQRGTFQFTEQPFAMCIKLPLAGSQA